jgi:hypothetical protein
MDIVMERARFIKLKSFVMNKSLHITATVDEPESLQNLIEQLAYRRYNTGYSKEKMPRGWKALETSSVETYVSGTIVLDFNNKEERINMPFITCFSFTCIKEEKQPYQLKWSSSLS